jgi:surface antigen
MRKLATSALVATAMLISGPAFAEAATDKPVTGQSALSSAPSWLKSWSHLPQTLSRSWQCVTFARFFSGLQIYGDAWTWWNGAEGKYARGQQPEAKSVLVFRKTGRMTRGHVAVVSNVLTDRVIQMTHANWSPIDGRRGQVEEDVTVVDVSAANDWSEVKVWFDPTKDLGGSAYPTYGFIYQPGTRPTDGTAPLETARTERRGFQLAGFAGPRAAR